MMKKHGAQRTCNNAVPVRRRWLALAVLGLVALLPWSALSACAMSALICVRGHILSDFPATGPASEFWAYDDPWDYFGFVMHNSAPGGNSDGYGVVAYPDQAGSLAPRNMWYKRVTSLDDFGSVYYTGNYLDPDPGETDQPPDVLDEALASVRGGSDRAAIVLCHARNASGLTLGNHPFWFEYRGRTFSFMHNGNCNTARSFMIARINELEPGGGWFLAHPSNYFHDMDPRRWVDTEVFFHYIMCHIVHSGNVLLGLRQALSGLGAYLQDQHTGIYNFIMSDGGSLYVFRSTPLSGANSSYKLCYKLFRDQFYGIRTQSPTADETELQLRELVVFSRSRKPEHYPDFPNSGPRNTPVYLPQPTERGFQQNVAAGLTVSPNPCLGSAFIRVGVKSASRLLLTVSNAKGQTVWKHSFEVDRPGIASIVWGGADERGSPVAPGIYLVRAQAGDTVLTGRIALFK